ncbi:glycoside hydrolase superfamily [Dactylonectria estremocensis]|uniref:non-reducing end alpha-L-arabinofuranosidase n=1 Tax=Dactylonectria estremocensis TaxID=1079267 RepID=A0A9P9IAQ8_9HYPO|nr:glycoside hydrolase superfamily [Dactylonectria estremocensis]
MIFLAALFPLIQTVTALSLSVASSGGNSSSQLLYGLLYEDIYHSGDGGLYGEMLRNRAFQGSGRGRVASFDRNTDFWHPVGGVSLSIDQSSPSLSSSLQYQLRMDVPAGTIGTVGFYNDGFWGFSVDATKRYITSMYVRGDYNGQVQCYFQNTISGQKLSSSKMALNQKAADGWKQTFSPTFKPTVTPGNGNNTFYFTFDGSQLAGKSIYINLLSLFKQTYNNRVNGIREDLMMSLAELNTKWVRIPGGNNMEGLRNGQEWKWNQTIGDLKDRPGMLGVWGDINTDGFGLLEQMQMAQDLNLTVILGVHAGLYLNGDVVSQNQLQPFVDLAMNELEFLIGDKSTANGAKRAALGYPSPFKLGWVEIGNEDYLNNGRSSYYSYRFMALYNAIRGKYPNMNIISTINPSPSPDKGSGGMVDLHIYDNENHFVGLYNTFDQASRDYPVFVAEYAVIRAGTGAGAEIGAQTFGMACAEAIFLLGCERNSDIIVGSAYGALIKHYDEEPNTVAVIKHTATEVLHTMSYYVQKLFADYLGTETLPVIATNGGVGPTYWSATKGSQGTILKLVNYNGQTGEATAVKVTFKGSSATTAKLTFLSAPSATSVNNLPLMGGETSQITVRTITAQNGQFSVAFSSPYQIAILVI